MTYSWSSVALLGFAIIVVVLLLRLFLRGDRYLRSRRPDQGVGFVQARLSAEEYLASLAPKLLEAAEKEQAVVDRLHSGAPLGGEGQRYLQELLCEANTSRIWRRFTTASSLTEDDPEYSLAELEALLPRVDAALEKLAQAEKACQPTDSGPPGRG